MGLGHEKLDVYRLSIGYVAWVYEKAASLIGSHRAARDQWLRASQSIPLNILVVGKALAKKESQDRKVELDRIAAMLSRLGGRGYCVKEKSEPYGGVKADFDEIKPRQIGQLNSEKLPFKKQKTVSRNQLPLRYPCHLRSIDNLS